MIGQEDENGLTRVTGVTRKRHLPYAANTVDYHSNKYGWYQDRNDEFTHSDENFALNLAWGENAQTRGEKIHKVGQFNDAEDALLRIFMLYPIDFEEYGVEIAGNSLRILYLDEQIRQADLADKRYIDKYGISLQSMLEKKVKALEDLHKNRLNPRTNLILRSSVHRDKGWRQYDHYTIDRVLELKGLKYELICCAINIYNGPDPDKNGASSTARDSGYHWISIRKNAANRYCLVDFDNVRNLSTRQLDGWLKSNDLPGKKSDRHQPTLFYYRRV